MINKIIQGIGVSEGIRFGQAFLYQPITFQDVREKVSADERESELYRLRRAKENCFNELSELIERTRQSLGEEKALILKGQQSFLADPVFYPEMEKLVENRLFSAENAVNHIVNKFVAVFDAMPNEYLQGRAADVKDVGKRLLANLQGGPGTRLSNIKKEVILVADDLTPSDTVQLDKKLILGFITRVGGKTSHTAILSRSMDISAVLGVGEGIDNIRDGDFLIIDGTAGLCIINPDSYTLKEYQKKAEKEADLLHSLDAYTFKPACTQDGLCVEIAGNIGTPDEAKVALEHGAEAIGLYRTELLFMSRDRMPGEEEQYLAYKKVITAMAGKAVVIRTMDIGGDKEIPYLSMPKEMNPFLGYRAIRMCLDRKELLVTQLRAILRASVHGNVKIMFPMISSLEEWRQAREVYEEARVQLTKEGVPVNPSIDLGIMIEVPSAALLAPKFAKEVDFFSIGTNDLVQYLLAVDRMNEKVAYLYDHFHPAVTSMLKNVIDAAHHEGKWVGMCGGMAGDPLAAPLLIGLGLDEWSMAAVAINKVKHVIAQVNAVECRKLTDKILQLDTTEEIRKELETFYATYIP